MTNPTPPNDEELRQVGTAGYDSQRGGFPSENMRRALYNHGFTHGERHGIERAIDELVRRLGRGYAVSILESLRPSPPVEKAEPVFLPGEHVSGTGAGAPEDSARYYGRFWRHHNSLESVVGDSRGNDMWLRRASLRKEAP